MDNKIIYQKLTGDNFGDNSLDEFIRHQQVTECWRNVDGKLTLTQENCREHTERYWRLRLCVWRIL